MEVKEGDFNGELLGSVGNYGNFVEFWLRRGRVPRGHTLMSENI